MQTLGGYHPGFVIPDHYPRVPRLGYNWLVDDQLSIKGEAYCALTASVLMAGLHVQATWNSGNLQAWFNVAVDFIIGWKPFHYDATAHASLGVSYTFQFFGTQHLSFEVGADLHIWGPDFSGQAHIDLDIISFDISFGGSPSQLPAPISWDSFKQSFLPTDDAICSIAATAGLISKTGNDATNLGIFNAKDFILVTNAVVPSNSAHISNDLQVGQLYYTQNGTQVSLLAFSAATSDGSLTQATPANAKTRATGSPAIGPVGVQANVLTSTHSIAITRDGSNVEHEFAYTPVLKNVPIGLWGSDLQPALNGPRFVSDTLTGFEITPAAQAVPGETAPIDRSKLQYDPETVVAYSWTPEPPPFQADALDELTRRQRISSSLVDPTVATARQQLCTALGIGADAIDVSQASTIASTFLTAPQIKKA